MCLEEIGSSMDSDALASQEVSFTPNGTHNSYIEIHLHIHVKLACGLYYCGWDVFPPRYASVGLAVLARCGM